MSTSTTFDKIAVGEYFSIPGKPGFLWEKIEYVSQSAGSVRIGFNCVVIKHPDKKYIGYGDYAMPDRQVIRESKRDYLVQFGKLRVGERVAFPQEPTTVIKKIRPRNVYRNSRIVNAFVVRTGITRDYLKGRTKGRSDRYIFVRPGEKLLKI